MEKRALIAVVISLVILIGYSYLEIKYLRPTAPPESSKSAGQTTQAANEKRAERRETGSKTESGTLNIPAVTTTTDTTTASLANEEDIVVENDVYKAVFTNRGGKIKKFYMKHYLDTKGHPLDLIPDGTDFFSLPLTLAFVGQDELSKKLDGAIYDVSSSSKKLFINNSNPQGRIEFLYTDKQHFMIKKVLTFHSGTYNIDVDIDVKNLEKEHLPVPYQILWGPGIFSDLSEQDAQNLEVSTLLNGKKTDIKASKVEKLNKYEGRIEWTAIHDKFFTAIFIPKEIDNTVVVSKNGKGELLVGLDFRGKVEAKIDSFTLYIGPKESARLKELGMGLDKIIDYGMFGILVEPLEKLLHWFYDYTGNYGVAIILLTVLVKIIFFPLTHKSFKSMQGMQTIQPKIKVLQEKYKNDKVRLNQEMMRIYRENKINPMGGCLPMVLQIPVFIALYQLLLNSIDLRMAPFFWWITDLSTKDPYYISPIIMGASMFIQQKMTPTAGDPKMAKMMLFMPVIFTVMFLQFPVGLVVYWLVNNILTIGQQLIISRMGAAEQLRKKNEMVQESK